MAPWFSKMRPREVYWETTLIPRSPVMQDSFTVSSGTLSFGAMSSLPAKLSVGNAKRLAVRMQNFAILFLVMVVWLVGCARELARRALATRLPTVHGFHAPEPS